MSSQPRPIRHLVRVRRTEDLAFLRPGTCDEVLLNANYLENNPESTASFLRQSDLPFSIDPVLTRFQMPEWWRNHKGDQKRNYARLGRVYVEGTTIKLPAGPLASTITSDDEWRTLARNIVGYQLNRLEQVHAQLDLFVAEPPRSLDPVRIMAPALVAFSSVEDRINALLAEASAEASPSAPAITVIVPPERLRDQAEVSRILARVPSDFVGAYFVWTPGVTEDLLLADRTIFSALSRIVVRLADRGIAVGHLHGTYATAALHRVGIGAIAHPLGWIDKGEPAGQVKGGPRSCQTYVPGVRHCVRFHQATRLGRELDSARYAELYCRCAFCTGAFATGVHPLELLTEDYEISAGRGIRRTPTSRAVGLNTWHFLLSRREEFEAFSTSAAADVISADIQRAAAMADATGAQRLRRLASELRTA